MSKGVKMAGTFNEFNAKEWDAMCAKVYVFKMFNITNDLSVVGFALN